MASPGVGGSLSAATDVVFNNPVNGQVIQRSGSYWVNSASAQTAVPTGGTTDQVLAKASSANHDTKWMDSVPLSNTNPASLTGIANPGTLDEVSRADHQHPISPALTYPVRSGMYSCPIGPEHPSNDKSLWSSGLFVTPLPVYAPVSITAVLTAANTTNFELAVYDSAPTTLVPRTRLSVASPVTSQASNAVVGAFATPLHLNAGLYWVAVRGTGNVTFKRPLDQALPARFICNNGHDFGNRCYEYSGQSSMPASLPTSPNIGNDGTFWYQIRME